MSSGLFGIAISGMNAAQINLLTTSNNITNASTDGYNRQRALQATNISVNTGAGAIGTGVRVVTIERMYSSYLAQQVNAAQTKVSSLDAAYGYLSQVDNLLADAEAGVSAALQNFFSGVQTVSADPSSVAARQSMVSSAQTLADRFKAVSGRVTEIRNEINGRLGDDVDLINSYAAQIADFNQQIILTQGASGGQPPNNLLDQRDLLVKQLGQLIGVTTTTNTDGSYNVYFGTGQQLVVGNRAQQLVAMPSAADPQKIAIGLKLGSGATLELSNALIAGGELSGLLAARNSLDSVENQIGRLAASVSLTFNAQLALGQDLLGNVAGDPNFASDLFSLTTATALTIEPNYKNTGSGSVSATFATPNAPQPPDYSGNFTTDLIASDYQVSFGAGGAYTVTRLSDNKQVATGTGAGSVSFDGIDLNIGAIGNNGDKFTLKPYTAAAESISVNQNIAADPRLIAAAGPVTVTPAIANTGNFTISQGVAGVGYTAPAGAVTLSLTATDLQGVPGAWTATYSDGTQVTGAGNIALTSGSATLTGFNYNNMYFSVAGTPPASGTDSFTIDKSAAGVQDGRNIQLLGMLQTQKTIEGGASNFQDAYARMVAANGIQTREAKVQLDAQTAILHQAEETQQSLSGVNLDEEAANLLKYQQAYQAASKIIQIQSTLFDTLLSIR
ncbi:MAG: flagellar hook-associated protein FlgK [Azonexus sp.]|jgi:flagellar hook-associated protein 1 FlgK|nr:flagellar hook-associated protein FlgK [Azonexus sp.]